MVALHRRPIASIESARSILQLFASRAAVELERKQSDDALRDSEEKYRRIVETANDGIWMADESDRTLFVNRRMAEMLGCSAEEMYGRRVSDFAFEEDRPALERRIAARRDGASESYEYRFRRADGGEIWCLVSAAPLIGREGKFQGSFAMITDLTARRRIEQALRHSEARFRVAASHTSDLIYEWNPATSRIEYLAPTEPKKPAFSRKPAANWDEWAVRIHPEDRDRVLEAARREMELGEAFNQVYRYRGDQGNWRYLSHRATMLDRGGPSARGIGVVTDITAEVQAREEKEQLQAQLAQAMKMEAMGRLAGGIAHDFNNLLTVINGYSELLMDSLGQEHPGRSEAAEIRKAGVRAAALTQQLLAFSRKQLLEPRILNLNTVIANVEKLLRRVLGEDIALVTSLEPELGNVVADPGQIEQVVMNLAVNARDAMPGGGLLRIETANVEVAEVHEAAAEDCKPGPYVKLAVTDTGTGFSDEARRHVFEPFFTTKETGKGTGLGLSTVYGIVRQSGGWIELDSVSGKGTTFRIYLPWSMRRGQDSESPKRTAGGLSGTETILLVEDQPEVRRLAVNILRRAGYVPLEVSSGEDALNLWTRNSPEVDLVITDLVMRGMSGSALVQRLKAIRPDLKFIYISGYAEDVMFQQGVTDERAVILRKPFSPENLRAKVREVLDTRRGA